MTIGAGLFLMFGALAAAVLWVIVTSRNHSAPDDLIKTARPRTRRDELIEARGVIRRQIEILCNPMRGSTLEAQQSLERLQTMLGEIEDELGGARTGPRLGQQFPEPASPHRGTDP